MDSKYFFVASALLLVVACGPDAAMAPSSARVPPRSLSATILTTTPVLWDQSGGTSDHVYSTGEATNALMADDFVVGTGSTWRISEVMLCGILEDVPMAFEIARSAGPNPSSDVIHNYALPPFASVPSPCAPTCGLRDYLFKLPTPLVLEPGHYWLVVVSVDRFSWHDRPPIAGTEHPVWRSDEGFGGAWVYLTLNDMSFALYGANRAPTEYAAELTTMIQQFGLQRGIANSLDAKLRAALNALNSGDTQAACLALQDLINESSAQSGKKLAEDQASAIQGQAAFIRELIGC